LRRSKASEGVEWTILQELAKTAKCPKKPFFWRDLQCLLKKGAVTLHQKKRRFVDLSICRFADELTNKN